MKFVSSFILYLFFVVFFVFGNTKTVYFYFQDQFFVIYNDENNKLFVDFNSGFVIKPIEQERKLKFVQYILDSNTFITRDEDVFTKLYILKKYINFDFGQVEPSNIDYYSWGPLTYKYLALFCKKINDSLTIRIPAYDTLPEETKRDIIDRYRLVFGTTFNEPRYLPFDITFKNISSSLGLPSNNQTDDNINTSKDDTTNTFINTTDNTTGNTMGNTMGNTNTNLVTTVPVVKQDKMDSRIDLKAFLGSYWKVLLAGAVVFLLILTGLFLRVFLFTKNNVNNNVNKNDFIDDNLDYKRDVVQMELNDEYKKIVDQIRKTVAHLEVENKELKNKINEITKKIEDLSFKIEKTINKRDLSSMENIVDESDNTADKDSGEYLEHLDRESLEMIMFKIDGLLNKLKPLEMYRDYDINSKASKVASELYEFKAKIRKTKTVNFLQWDNIIKNFVIDLISSIDKYLSSFGGNENLQKIKKDIILETEIEQIHIVPGQTKVNIIDHRVESYSRNPNIPTGVITEVKEEGYKYKGITIKRAKVVENRI